MPYAFGFPPTVTTGGSGGGGGASTVSAPAAATDANGATITGSALALEIADATHPGIVTTGAQTIAGVKTLTSPPVMSGAGITAASIPNAALVNGAVANLSGTNTGDQTNITGNAATVTTNANLTGPVTSVGNATAIANGAISNAMLANAAVANLSGTNTGDVSLAAVGAAPSANGASLSGQVLTLQPADATHPGIVTTGAQTIAGVKAFSGDIQATSTSTAAVKITGGGFLNFSTPGGAVFLSGSANNNYLRVDDGVVRYLSFDTSAAQVVYGSDANNNTVVPNTPTAFRAGNLLAGGTADQAGANLTIAAGNSKGAGTPPTVQIQVPPLGTTGTTLNTPATVAKFGYDAAIGGQAVVITGALKVTGSFAAPSASTIVVAGTTAAPNWSTGSTQTIDISGASGNVTATFSNPVTGGMYTVVVLCKTGLTFTFAAASGAFKWAGGVAPTITSTTGKTDVFQLYYDGTNYLERSRAQNQ